ncbi:MAG: hypothetical protein ACOYI3_04770 [Christensenellales bacterium]
MANNKKNKNQQNNQQQNNNLLKGGKKTPDTLNNFTGVGRYGEKPTDDF